MLIAEKTIAMADRNMLKDIYDLWRGFKTMKEPKKYKTYLEIAGERQDIDVFSYIPTQVAFMRKNLAYYKKETIDVQYQPPIDIMLNEIEKELEKL